MFLKRITGAIAQAYANTSWERKRRFLLKRGAQIGEGTRLNCRVNAFGSEPYLIRVGKDCLFASGVHFVTHDGGIKVLNTLGKFSESKHMDCVAPIVIGDNVYIGMDAFVMPGTVIGSNVVIGAGAIVTHDVPDNSVAVGVPAKVIKSIDAYYESMQSKGNVFPTGGWDAQKKRAFYTEKYRDVISR